MICQNANKREHESCDFWRNISKGDIYQCKVLSIECPHIEAPSHGHSSCPGLSWHTSQNGWYQTSGWECWHSQLIWHRVSYRSMSGSNPRLEQWWICRQKTDLFHGWRCCAYKAEKFKLNIHWYENVIGGVSSLEESLALSFRVKMVFLCDFIFWGVPIFWTDGTC